MPERTIALVIHDGVQALDVAGPLDVFVEANESVGADQRYVIRVVGPDRGVVHASNGLAMVPDLGFAEAGCAFDTVLVAGGPSLPAQQSTDPAMLAWLCDWAVRAGRYGSICTGAFVLGRAGLLDGKTVSTHWKHADRLAREFPAAIVEPDRIHVRDGRLITSAGVTAGIDLALALVSEDHGADVALACARQLVVVAQRQGGQSQFSPMLVRPAPPGSALARLHDHVQHHLRDALPIERMAAVAGVSPRSLARLFAEELATTPHEFVLNARIDLARNLLESSDLPLKRIAFECGFGNAERMRAVFQRRLGISPLAYRGSFPASPRPAATPPSKMARP
ncbi:AraC family transcriptional regulator [Novosphingobium sp. FSW06-99]|nr:GlxA family transcriptional regulator [Novosphingobium sp. FSW06-99]KUR74962.1 AraC family transcriptional regulator [Novosphingobium sp. FSW06-99]